MEGNEASGIFWGPTERYHTEKREAGPAPSEQPQQLCVLHTNVRFKRVQRRPFTRDTTVRGCLLLFLVKSLEKVHKITSLTLKSGNAEVRPGFEIHTFLSRPSDT